MSEPFLGEIRITSFAFPPKGWALCNGQLLLINTNQALFSILGTTYGGDGRTTFALPDLRGRAPAHFGGGMVLGQSGGVEGVTLNQAQVAPHTHTLSSQNGLATTNAPAGGALAKKPFGGRDIYAPPNSPTPLSPASITPAGGSQSHENRQPYLTLNFVIALQGIFPSRD